MEFIDKTRREFMKKVGFTAFAVAVLPEFLIRHGDLPSDVKLFSSYYGQMEFMMYARDGGLSTTTLSYLVTGDGMASWGFNPRAQSPLQAYRDAMKCKDWVERERSASSQSRKCSESASRKVVER